MQCLTNFLINNIYQTFNNERVWISCDNEPYGDHPLSYVDCSKEDHLLWHHGEHRTVSLGQRFPGKSLCKLNHYEYQNCCIDIDIQTFSTGKLGLGEYPMGSDKLCYTLPVAIEVNCTNQIKLVKSSQKKKDRCTVALHNIVNSTKLCPIKTDLQSIMTSSPCILPFS